MTTRWSGPQARRDAPALRFLSLCVGGWIVLRVMMNWNPGIPVPPDAARPPWAPPSPFAIVARPDGLPSAAVRVAAKGARPAPRATFPPSAGPMPEGEPVEATGPAAGGLGADRHSLRFALMARLLQPRGREAAALPAGGAPWSLMPPAAAEPGRGQPWWMQRQLAGWSLGGWLYLRAGSGTTPGGIAAGGQLGGSQAGIRLAHGFGESGRTRAYGRATIALQRPQQRELALGLAFAPARHLPIDIAVERRVAVGNEGRNAFAAMVVGGVGDVALPAGFRLDAYGQAGVVGTRRRDGFADGAVVVDRQLGRDGRSSLHLGALAAGAVQPGAARVDVGPRLTLRLPQIGEGSRLALDWRQRVAGDARPESGLALTLASDF